MMNPDDHGHDRDLRGQEPPGAGPGDPSHDYGVQGGPGQLGIIFPAQAQVSEVGSPIDPGAGADYGMREAGTGNIGSIITMLIDEGNTVDIDDILTEEQCRQSQCSQEGSVGSHQPKIKEEVEPVQISDYGAAYQEFSFSGEPQYSREASTSQGWSHPAHTGHTNESLITVPSLSMPRSMSVNCLPSPASGAGARDDKYWERRRKNNLAAKKSRDTRRMRENQLRLRVLFLENANKVLREQMERKDCESGKLRERLRLYESTDVNCHNNQ